jgi:hypothetical protein
MTMKTTIAARTAVGGALVMAGMVTLAGPWAPAAGATDCALTEQMTISPTSGPAGATVTVSGTGFTDGCAQSGETVSAAKAVAIVFNQNGKEHQLAIADAGPGPNYAIKLQVQIPTDAATGPANISARSAAAIFTVSGAATPGTVPAATTGAAPLPTTGSDSRPLALFATGLVLVGAGFTVAGMRRIQARRARP